MGDGLRRRGQEASRVVVLAVLATTSALLGLVYALLGSRYSKYERLQWELASEAERRLPEELRLIDRVNAVRREHAAAAPSGTRYELSRAERWLSTSDLVVWAPVALCVASLVLLTMSFLPR